MTNEQKEAYDWAKRQKYGSVAATYARELAGVIDELQSQLAEANRRADAAVRDLHMVSSCKTCVTLCDSSVPTSFCLSCVKKGKCNYKWRGVTE